MIRSKYMANPVLNIELEKTLASVLYRPTSTIKIVCNYKLKIQAHTLAFLWQKSSVLLLQGFWCLI